MERAWAVVVGVGNGYSCRVRSNCDCQERHFDNRKRRGAFHWRVYITSASLKQLRKNLATTEAVTNYVL
jgi:hypothetical protein